MTRPSLTCEICSLTPVAGAEALTLTCLFARDNHKMKTRRVGLVRRHRNRRDFEHTPGLNPWLIFRRRVKSRSGRESAPLRLLAVHRPAARRGVRASG